MKNPDTYDIVKGGFTIGGQKFSPHEDWLKVVPEKLDEFNPDHQEYGYDLFGKYGNRGYILDTIAALINDEIELEHPEGKELTWEGTEDYFGDDPIGHPVPKYLRSSFPKKSYRGDAMETKKEAVGWEKKPKGWTKDSMKKYMKTLTGDRKHKVTKCIKELKGAEWLDDPSDPAPLCASIMDEIAGTGWRKGPRKKRKKSDTTEAEEPRSGFKTWLLNTLNSPEEKEAKPMRRRARRSRRVVDLGEADIRRQLIARARARAAMAEDFDLEDEEMEEEYYVPRFSRYSRRSRYEAPPVRSRRRSRLAAETSLNREHNKTYDEPDAEDSAPWVEDDYADRPYSGPKPPKNVIDDSHVSAGARRRIRAAMRRAAEREERALEREAYREEIREERALEREAEFQSLRLRPRRRLARRSRRSYLR